MKDKLGRNINYMRLSITDRCNLRCKYCMPVPREFIPHSEILSYEDFLKIAGAAVKLGIVNFKVTGGEPLVRKGAVSFIKFLKIIDGVRQVTLTTNGILLENYLEELIKAGIDGINISIDALSRDKYREITGDIYDFNTKIIENCVKNNIKLKLNTVLLGENADEWLKIVGIAEEMPVDVRFIELMPIGFANAQEQPKADTLLSLLKDKYPDLKPVSDVRGNGPARYFGSQALKGRIGVIGAHSQKFCDKCNRVRVTSTGVLKPCLSYDGGTDLKTPLKNGASIDELAAIIKNAVLEKPASHCFEGVGKECGSGAMNGIGG